MLTIRLLLSFVIFNVTILSAQQSFKIHSHNDYSQLLPFWKAYNCDLESIEVDVLYKNNVLYATHTENEIIPDNTLETLYLKPLNKIASTHLEKGKNIQLLIDVKSEAYSTLEAIEKALKKYPELINHPKITFVISGNRPLIKDYKNYPNYILFDYQSLKSIPTESLHKIALISLSYHSFSTWKGLKSIPKADLKKIKNTVNKAHSLNKPFRFWGAPDTELAWKTFYNIGLDFINTDHPLECSNYFRKLTESDTDTQIAFISDIHFQDIYGNLSDTDYKGVFNNQTKKFTLLRTMESQLYSTRIFNENYFALFTTLDDIVKKGIKYVALPGDFTDDGQTVHVRGLKQVLESYSNKYGIQFFITTGNHDPVGPFSQEAGKSDFMGIDGQNQGIYSTPKLNTTHGEFPDIITKDIQKLGYEGIFNHLKPFGFFPQKNYLYWATPFTNYTAENYTYEKALKNASIENRMYNITSNYTVPDASYVVEPTPNVWLLAIDANVYIPKDTINGKALNSTNYQGAGIGYNNVLTHKKHLIKWAKEVADEAKRLNKTLIAFSHYPMIDFNDDASKSLNSFFEGPKWQLKRIPKETVAQLFSNAGITIHVAGHMHINDTGYRKFSNGKSLVNIQTPSIAAYIPGYKILKIKTNNLVEVNTVTIDSVANFNTLFSLYKKEYAYLKKHNKPLWNYNILNTKTYHEFTMFHLKELVETRFLKDWAPYFKDFMLHVTGEELLIFPYLNSKTYFKTILNNKKLYKSEWKEAKNKAKTALSQTNFTLDDFKNWNGFDMIFDFYRIRNADVLAIDDIGTEKVTLYKWMFENYKTQISITSKDLNKKKLLEFSNSFSKFLNGAPSNNFIINYKTGEISNIK